MVLRTASVDDESRVCNLYSVTKGQAAITALARAMRDRAGNLAPLPAVFPDTMAPVVRTAADGIRELAMMRWGFPPPNPVIIMASLGGAKSRPPERVSSLVALPRRCGPLYILAKSWTRDSVLCAKLLKSLALPRGIEPLFSP
jgi:hypothetical protein